MFVVRVSLAGDDVDVKVFEALPQARTFALAAARKETGDASIYAVPAVGDPRLAKRQFESKEGELIEAHLMAPDQKAAHQAFVSHIVKSL